jgi:hypothetical protein
VVAYGISTVVGPEGQHYALNATALALWELCDGLTTSEEMVSAICVLFDADRPVIAADVQRALGEFESRHLLEWVDCRIAPPAVVLSTAGQTSKEPE